jgi:membrane associated rhomboid family serine protease
VIPISDDNPARRPAVVTWAIIVLCVVAYLWERSLGREMNAAFDVLGFVPANYFSGPDGSTDIAVPTWLTIFTSMFLHGGLLHIGGNMLYLWIFGNNVEDAMGHLRFFFFYFACGVAAALGVAYLDRAPACP